jgi:hypothetical protein
MHNASVPPTESRPGRNRDRTGNCGDVTECRRHERQMFTSAALLARYKGQMGSCASPRMFHLGMACFRETRGVMTLRRGVIKSTGPLMQNSASFRVNNQGALFTLARFWRWLAVALLPSNSSRNGTFRRCAPAPVAASVHKGLILAVLLQLPAPPSLLAIIHR